MQIVKWGSTFYQDGYLGGRTRSPLDVCIACGEQLGSHSKTEQCPEVQAKMFIFRHKLNSNITVKIIAFTQINAASILARTVKHALDFEIINKENENN